jgi:hypothetical protein
VWGQDRSSTSKWRRHGNRTDERTCTLLEIIGDLVEVEEIGIYTFPPPHTHTQKKTGEWARKTKVSTRKQGYKQENIDKILWEDERAIFITVIKAATKGSEKRK